MKNDGGPVFPQTHESWNRSCDGTLPVPSGMSLRDWFAGMVLAHGLEYWGADNAHLVAKASYEIADAMLAERQCDQPTKVRGEG